MRCRFLWVTLIVVMLPYGVIAQTCDQTLSTGANIAAAISGAGNNTTICLNNGNYGLVNLFDMSRSGFVTVRSTTGTGAQISPQVGNSDFIRFSSLTLTDMLINSCSTNIEILNSIFVEDAAGLLVANTSGGACDPGQNILIENTIFQNLNLGPGGFEGTLHISGGDDVIVRGCKFGGTSHYGDGIQVGGGTNVVIGPDNTFDGINQAYCDANGGAHCDAVQLYGAGAGLIIKQNWFRNGDTFIMSPDGCDTPDVVNNVFDGTGLTFQYRLQFGSCDALHLHHNTFKDSAIAVDSKVGEPASTDALVENNIYTGNTDIQTTGGNGCTNCIFRYGLWDDAPSAEGTNNVIGTPTYVGGGTDPDTWAGWQLATGSAGENAGNDGQDMGTLYYGSSSPSPPLAAPLSLRIILQ